MSHVSVCFVCCVPICFMLVCALYVVCLYVPIIKSSCLSPFYNHLGVLFLDTYLNLMVHIKGNDLILQQSCCLGGPEFRS
jgi:hypothetical protein